MSTWTDRPIHAFDLETTGPDPTRARIVTACVAGFAPGAAAAPPPRTVRTWLVDPGVPIPDGAAAIHGVTTATAQEHGLSYADGYAQIRSTLQAVWEAGEVVTAFNAAFDLTVMDAEGRRLGYPPLEPGLVADPYVIDREMDRYRRGKRTLQAVCGHYGVRLDSSHEAEADAVAAAHLVRALVSGYPQLSGLDIVAEQTRWHAERQRDFAEYLRRVGRDASDVDGQWPLRR